jgi:hypothetical protein
MREYLIFGEGLNSLQRFPWHLLIAYRLDSAWSFYEMQSSHLSSICPNLLMRILVVDSQPLELLLQASLSSEARWQTR